MSWQTLSTSLRGSGRTTKLLAEARRVADAGKAVAIVCDNSMDMRHLKMAFGTEHQKVSFVLSHTLDWEKMALIGLPDTVVLIDHHAIEDRFAALLEMLHRFDP